MRGHDILWRWTLDTLQGALLHFSQAFLLQVPLDSRMAFLFEVVDTVTQEEFLWCESWWEKK